MDRTTAAEGAGLSLLRQVALLEAALGRVGTAICVCDRDWILDFANPRFAEAWELDASSLVPGMPLATLLANGSRSEPSRSEAVDAYLAWCLALDADAGEQARDIRLGDGRVYRARHCPLADGAWLVTLDDMTAEAVNAELASERLSLQSLIDTVPDYLWVKDVDSRFVIANKALASDWGREPAEIIGLSDHDFHPPERAAGFAQSERAIVETDQPMVDRHEFVLDSQGQAKWFSSTKMPLKDMSGTTVGIVGISRDITELRCEVSFREGQAAVLEMIATATPLDAILGSIAALIEAQISDASASILLSGPERRRIGGENGGLSDACLDRILDGLEAEGTAAPGSLLAVSPIDDEAPRTGRRRPAGFQTRGACWSMGITSQDKILGVLAVRPTVPRPPGTHETAVIEIAARLAGIAVERRTSEERIRHMANHDALTGLANRSMLGDLLSRAVDDAGRRGDGFRILFIDLDDFKPVNDTLGHHVGDQLLKEVARRLAGSVGPCDSVIRLGGDEFVAILAGHPADAAGSMDAVQRIVASVASPFEYGGHRLEVSCSVGVARYPDDGDTPESLLTKADLAMYEAKQNGKGRFTPYAGGA